MTSLTRLFCSVGLLIDNDAKKSTERIELKPLPTTLADGK